jgi:hypothetical protein
VGLERGPLSLVSTIEELLGKSRRFGLEIREHSRGDASCGPHGTLYPQKIGTNFIEMRRSLTDSGHGVV